MAANINVAEGNGSTATWTDITSARFCTADVVNPGLSYPIPIPSSGVHYSFWKNHRLEFGGTFTQIDNIRWYCDGSINWTLGTNGKVIVGTRDSGDNGCPDANYQAAAGVTGSSGYAIDDPTSGHAYYKGQTTPYADIAGYTVGSPLLVDSSAYTAEGNSKHVVLQCIVDHDASHGTQASETFTWMWDEIVLLFGVGLELFKLFSSVI